MRLWRLERGLLLDRGKRLEVESCDEVERRAYGVRRWLRLEKTFSVVKILEAEDGRQISSAWKYGLTYSGLACYSNAMVSARRIARRRHHIRKAEPPTNHSN